MSIVNKNKVLSSIFVIIVLLIILGFYMLEIPRESLNYYGLLFLVIGLTISFSIVLFELNRTSNKSQVFQFSFTTVTTSIYLIYVVILTILVNNFESKLMMFIFLHILGMGILAISLLIGNKVATSINARDKEVRNTDSNNEPRRGGF